MIERKNILPLLVFLVSGVMTGLLVMLIASWSVLHALDKPFSLMSLRSLYQYDSIYYLLRLIPFLFAIVALLPARKFLKEKEKTDRLNEQNKKTVSSVMQFVQEISNDKLNHTSEALSLPGELKEAMEEMRQHLLVVSEKEKESNKISSTIAEINELLRPINELKQLADEVTRFLVNIIESAVQGAFYIVAEREKGVKETEQTLLLISVYAYDRKKHLQTESRFSDGIIGQAALEKDIIHLTEIPDDYVSITSGLTGHKKPGSILVLPLVNNEEVNGVIELASVSRFSETQIRLISELGEIIARSISSVKAHEKTIHLLKSSEKMSAELGEQKKQLMQNAQEMIATQEQLEKANITLGQQMQEVRTTNQKTHIILENSLEIIFIYNAAKKTTYVSPSILPVLGYFPDDITGKKCTENIHPLDTERFEQFLSEIISFPEKRHSLQYRYFTKNGDILWMEAIGKNSPSDLIEGIVMNARDISEQKKAEKEQRIRAKMQALSENSPDIIIRIDIFSRCTYVNPAIEKLTGMKIEDFIDKPLANVGLDESVVSFFKKTLEEVSQTHKKKTDEMIFPNDDEEMILEVSAMPEFYENGDIESVLFVCHDITTARKREEVISKKNKSIQDSINYAYYIQSSLMPTEANLQSVIPNSFMLYLPKDIVSGDYPFFYRDKDTVYIGAMDCTGHGVPGALMSIIGHFLQNEIIYDDCPEDAGQILTKLHKNVVSSLRQEDEDSKINDGMDAAFCKIDLKTKTLNFAGAHRPLYYVKNGQFTEIRGDKYPVGSTQYTNRKDFTNHTIDITPGDAFYLTTDGFADQYGGPDGKKKFLSGRVNLLIKENTHLSIFQMGKLFKKTHDDWRGDVGQLDDILVIGMKF
jgi:PAS domain S-box-containing protein